MLFLCVSAQKRLIQEKCVMSKAKAYCTIMNTALIEAVRHTVGLVTQQLC